MANTSTENTRNSLKGYLLLCGCCLSWAAFTLTIDYFFRTFAEVPPLQVAAYGLSLASLLLSPFFLGIEKMRRRVLQEIKQHFKLMSIAASLTSCGALLWFIAISTTSSGIVALLGPAKILFSVMLGLCFLKETLLFREWLSLSFMILGIIIISNLEGEIVLITALILLLARFLYSLQGFLIKRWGGKIDTLAFIYPRAVLMASYFWIIAALFTTDPFVEIPLNGLCIIVGCEVLAAYIANFFYFEAHKHLPLSKLNISLVLHPLLVLIGSWIFFHDPISFQKCVGAVLVLGSLSYFSYLQIKEKKE